MSIQSEITRISGNVSGALAAISNKGVTVPSGSNSDDLATLIAQISGTGGVTQDQDGFLVLDDSGSGGGSVDIVTTVYGSVPFDYSSTTITSLEGSHVFSGWSMRNVSLPNLTTYAVYDATSSSSPPNYMFAYCQYLRSVYMPLLRTGAQTQNGWYNCPGNMFYNCTALTYADSDSIGGLNTGINVSVFNGCTALETCDFRTIGNIANYAWRYCSSFNKLILRNNSVTNLGNINAFEDSPFASDGTGGTLYVPSAVVSSYQSASNWSTILGYANNSIVAIEGSYYETHYGNGTLITT